MLEPIKEKLVGIVIAMLCLFMGWRVGIVVGVTLLLTVSGTLFLMRVANIEMERISLGALIIAMGMLVDNAIVIGEGKLINMQLGVKTHNAASQAASRMQWPLLGATVIGIMAFSGIGLSPDITGEFLFSLFAVIGMSLLLSWFLAVTVTPLLGNYLLKVKGCHESNDPYKSIIYAAYRQVLKFSLMHRWIAIAALLVVTATSFWAFGFVRQSFFSNSNNAMFFIDYQLPQGADIRATARDIAEIDQRVLEVNGVESVASFIGQGASRFMLTYEPQQPNTGYGQLIVRTSDRFLIDDLALELRQKLSAAYPNADIRTHRVVFGPPTGPRLRLASWGQTRRSYAAWQSRPRPYWPRRII